MRLFKTALLASAVMGALMVAGAPAAQADYLFSGTDGGPGTWGYLSSGSESWTFNYDGGAGSTGYLDNWGSPGVGGGTNYYGESSPAYGMVITFTGGGPINADSIAVGNGAACVGSTGGGTTFCTLSPQDIWVAFQSAPDTIQFLAQDPSYTLSQNQDYFVNIFFDGTAPTAFSGRWLTEFSPNPTGVPEPASLALLGSGLIGLSLLRRRKGG